MQRDAHRKDDFISYPTDRVVGTIADPDNARRVIEALGDAGFNRGDIDVLHGEHDLHRLDPTGQEHGLLARFQRTLIRTAGNAEEYRHLKHHIDDVRAGRFVIMVLAPGRKRDVAGGIMNSHGAEYIGFYGRWAYQALDVAKAPHGDARRDLPVLHTYEEDVDGEVTRVGFETETAARVAHTSRGDATVRAQVTTIRPGVFMLSWQDAGPTTVIHVDDVDAGSVHSITVQADGTLRHATGTLRRVS